jgi:ParB/RepB/Spo0J family partition protein
MTTTTFTVTEIALNKLDVAAANVRRTGRGNGIEELAASIAAHGLLQSLVVRPTLDDSGAPIGRYEVVAGGRRLAALKRLAKRKAFGKTGPVPCRVLDGEDAGEASLAENVVRLDMHPADQFEAFARLHQDGQGWASRTSRPGSGSPVTLSGNGFGCPPSPSACCALLQRLLPEHLARRPRRSGPHSCASTASPTSPRPASAIATFSSPATSRRQCAAISNPLPPEGIHLRDFVSARGLADIWGYLVAIR